MPLIINKEMPVYKKLKEKRPESLVTEASNQGGKVIKIQFLNLYKINSVISINLLNLHE